jgi:hypothetical protein
MRGNQNVAAKLTQVSMQVDSKSTVQNKGFRVKEEAKNIFLGHR